jgi:hypothetical protein
VAAITYAVLFRVPFAYLPKQGMSALSQLHSGLQRNYAYVQNMKLVGTSGEGSGLSSLLRNDFYRHQLKLLTAAVEGGEKRL